MTLILSDKDLKTVIVPMLSEVKENTLAMNEKIIIFFKKKSTVSEINSRHGLIAEWR